MPQSLFTLFLQPFIAIVERDCMTQTRFIPRSVPEGPSLEGLPDWFSALLRSRGVLTDAEAARFLSPSLADLHDPFLLPGMEKTVALLREAISKGETILVYGDYDADGVCAASILLEALHEEHASLAYRIPSRHTEGYGLHADAVREIARKASLLITVDCGISNAEEVALAKQLGLTVIITDHHQPPEVLPPAEPAAGRLSLPGALRRRCRPEDLPGAPRPSRRGKMPGPGGPGHRGGHRPPAG